MVAASPAGCRVAPGAAVLAVVREAASVRRGLAHRLKGEVVSARIIKQFGSDTVSGADGIRRAIEDYVTGIEEALALPPIGGDDE